MYADEIGYIKNNCQDRIKFPKDETKMFQNKYTYEYDDYPKIIDIREESVIKFRTVDGVEQKLTYFPNYLTEEEAKDLYDYLVENINWKQREGVNKDGEKYLEPRKTCWFGKPYKYSAVDWDENEEWDKRVEELRIRLNKDHHISEGKEYNSVMCNYYRDNKDSIGWHADDETSLGRFPKIASISLGCERVFEVCKRYEYYNRNNYNSYNNNPVFNGCSILYKFHLNPGSLLLMEGAIQEGWLHRVPKENDKMNGRINLTYRYIVTEEEEKAEIERRKELKEKRKRISYNKNQYENRNQSANNSDDNNGFNKDRKIYKKDKDESYRGYSQNGNRSNNNYYNKDVRGKRFERENDCNNYPEQYNRSRYQKNSQYSPDEWKSEQYNRNRYQKNAQYPPEEGKSEQYNRSYHQKDLQYPPEEGKSEQYNRSYHQKNAQYPPEEGKSEQYNRSHHQKDSQYSPEEGKSENKDSCSEEIATKDFHKFLTR